LSASNSVNFILAWIFGQFGSREEKNMAADGDVE